MPPLAGPRLLVFTLVVELLLCGAVLATPSPDVAELRATIRVTAAISLVCFLSAFCASAIHARRPTPGTRWLVANRRWVGLSFAASHVLHGIAIAAYASRDPSFTVHLPVAIAGGLGYVAIALLAATSNDAAVRALGPRRWRALHVTGLYYLWLVFALTYSGPATHSPFHAAVTAVLLAALVLRLLPVRAPASARRPSPASA